jgi:hypothetical protein
MPDNGSSWAAGAPAMGTSHGTTGGGCGTMGRMDEKAAKALGATGGPARLSAEELSTQQTPRSYGGYLADPGNPNYMRNNASGGPIPQMQSEYSKFFAEKAKAAGAVTDESNAVLKEAYMRTDAADYLKSPQATVGNYTQNPSLSVTNRNGPAGGGSEPPSDDTENSQATLLDNLHELVIAKRVALMVHTLRPDTNSTMVQRAINESSTVLQKTGLNPQYSAKLSYHIAKKMIGRSSI